MTFLEQNIKGLCSKSGIDFNAFLSDFSIDSVYELSVTDIDSIAEEYEVDIQSLLFSPLFDLPHLSKKLSRVKFLVLDVDGVMTDAGMYYTENGDQLKKFNAKDGMGIMSLSQSGIGVGIISSGFYGETIRKRAEILKISHCYIGREPKLEILKNWCTELAIDLKEVAIIGDDVNDLEIINAVGFSACPKDAVREVKDKVDLILTKRGGEGCIREFIDNYFLIARVGDNN